METSTESYLKRVRPTLEPVITVTENRYENLYRKYNIVSVLEVSKNLYVDHYLF